MSRSRAIIAAALALAGAAGPARAEQLRLTMEDAVAQALARNFTVRIGELGPRIAREAVRAEAGRFDPALSSEYRYTREGLAGYDADDEAAAFRFGVGSLLPWGTRWEAVVEGDDRSTPFDPLTGGPLDGVSSFAGIVVTQPLLREFGLDGTWAGVRIARGSAAVAWEEFRAGVMDVVEQTVAAYQAVYFAQESLRIAVRNRDLALQLLGDNRRRVETGSMAPLDLVQAESEAALREESVISARAGLRQAVNALKALVWDDPASVLELELEIAPPAEPGFFEPLMERDLRIALESRPEYIAARHGLDIRELELRQLRRNELPQVDLVASAGRRGIDRDFYGSVGLAFDDGEPGYSVGAVVSIPFPNRTRSAERTGAYLRRNQAELGLQQLEQQIRLELDDAATFLVAGWQRIQAARTARELAGKSLQAEEKKLRAGTSTTFVVLRLQGDLAIAEIREINALADYTVALARYHRARGRILEHFNISLRP